MYDQANDLRRLVRQGSRPADGQDARPRLLLATSGKGGVGTSTVAVNLAVALARKPHRVVLVDADPDGGDAALLCRLQERYTMADVLSARRTVREALQPGPGGIEVLPGAWAAGNISECSSAAQERLIDQLQDLGPRADFIVLDVGKGCNRLVQRFWQAADAALLITTAELASVMDTYASIRVLAGGNRSVPVHVLVNKTSSAAVAGEVQARLARACRRFLGIRLSNVGHLPADPQVEAAGGRGEPFVLAAPGGPSARHIGRVAQTLAKSAAHARAAPGRLQSVVRRNGSTPLRA